MREKRHSRQILIATFILIVLGGLGYAFRPQPVIVELSAVERGALMVTVDEEARTRVKEAYMVSTPVNGQLLRIVLHPGDPVIAGQTAIAHMRPVNPAILDVRTREQARAEIAGAEAALQVALADLEAAIASHDLALAELRRTTTLAERGSVSQAALERAESEARAAEARRRTAEASIVQRRADLKSAQLQLVSFDDLALVEAAEKSLSTDIPIVAPADGQILRVLHEDQTTLPAGAPIVLIGDIEKDLEVVAELVSTDAVRVHPGDPVIIEDWGGAQTLKGEVLRIEPFGETRVSALGVEEQRVLVVITLVSPYEEREGLGHGYRVGVRIVIWQADDALLVPNSALFREGDAQSVFVEDDGVAVVREVSTGRDNGLFVEVLDGLAEGENVVVYPPPRLQNGDRIERRKIEQ